MGQRPSTFSPQFVFDYFIRPQAEFEARCRTALTALAIERFRNGHGGLLPGTLAEVAKELKFEVPVDPFDGNSIRYLKLPNGYRVHSVGADGTDDGGVPETQNSWYGGPPVIGADITFSLER